MFFVIFVLVFSFKHFIHSFIFIYTLSPLFPAMPFILFIFIVLGVFFVCVASLISRESFQMLSHRQTEEESSAWGEKTRQHLPGFYWWEQNKRRLHSVATLVKTFLKMISFTQKGVCVSVIDSDWIVFFFFFSIYTWLFNRCLFTGAAWIKSVVSMNLWNKELF